MPETNSPTFEGMVFALARGAGTGVASISPENATKINFIIQALADNAEPTAEQVQEVLRKLEQAIEKSKQVLSRMDDVGDRVALAVSSGVALGNTGLAVGGGAIVLKSGKNFLYANNKVAKMFYVLSVLCSGTGAVSSGIDACCRKCGLSRTGMLGDGFGGLFLYAGNKANDAGEVLEGKKSLRNFFLSRGRTNLPRPKFGSGY